MKKQTALDIAFIFCLSLCCHFIFSKYGFNPTDEGFVLSSSNRILHGQIPHIDFSSLRPLGYAYLHIPELLISKKYMFLVSRYVFWFEQVLIAFLWVRFVQQYLGVFQNAAFQYILMFMCLVFNVHYFPVAVLHTIDGLLFAVAGLFLLQKKPLVLNLIGTLFIGFSVLCKQGFIIMIPAAFILFWNKRITLLLSFLPVLVYVVILYLKGGATDLKLQLTGHTEIVDIGFKSYLFNQFFWLGIIAVIIIRRFKFFHIYWFFQLILLCFLLVRFHYYGKVLFFYSGLLTAEILIALINFKIPLYSMEPDKVYFENEEMSGTYHYAIYSGIIIRLAICTLAIMWCVSISIGYNTPALFLGGYWTFVALVFNLTTDAKSMHPSNYIALILIASIFIYVRLHFIYRDNASSELTYQLGELTEGTSGIYTNKNTYDLIKEIAKIKKQQADKAVFLPDFTALQIASSHLSKIKTEWPNKTEIPNEQILYKVASALDFKDTSTYYYIAKYQTAQLADTLIPLTDQGNDYRIIRYVKEHTSKQGETRFFEIYQK